MATNETRRTEEEVGGLVAEVKRQHTMSDTVPGWPWCRECKYNWPCPAVRLVNAIESQSAEVERLRARVAEYDKLAIRAKEYANDHGKQSAVAIITSLASLAPEEGATT